MTCFAASFLERPTDYSCPPWFSLHTTQQQLPTLRVRAFTTTTTTITINLIFILILTWSTVMACRFSSYPNSQSLGVWVRGDLHLFIVHRKRIDLKNWSSSWDLLGSIWEDNGDLRRHLVVFVVGNVEVVRSRRKNLPSLSSLLTRFQFFADQIF